MSWPRNNCTPRWSLTPSTVDDVVVWCELARQDDIDAANWSGPMWPGSPPPSEDEGYDPSASGFSVSEVRLIMGATNNDFTFSIQDPAGALVAVVNPPWRGSYSIPYTIADGKGIWTITINRTTTASVPAPSLLQGGPAGNPVREPFVLPYGHSNEGILGIEFVGEEIFCPKNTDVELTAEIESPAGSGNYQNISRFSCIPANTPIRFTTTVAPGTATIQKYMWDFKDPNAPVLPTSPNSNFIESVTSAASDSQTHFYSQSLPNNQSYAPVVQVFLPPCDSLADSANVRICPVCPSITALTANPNSGNAPLTVNFQATVTNAGQIVPDIGGNLYHWDFGDGATADTPTRNTSHMYTTAGTFSATVTVDVSGGCSATAKSTTVTVTQGPGCPSLTGLTATPASGNAPLTVSFMASVTNPGAIVPDAAGNLYHWDFGDGRLDHTSTSSTSHTYATAGPFAASVTVNVPPGCPATTASAGVTVTGDGGGSSGGGSSDLCTGLLIAAIVLLILGALLVIIGVCSGIYWIWIAGAIVGVIGLVLFIIWAAVCAALTPCSVMQTVHCVLFWIVAVVGPILVGIAALLGGLPCSLAAAAGWGGWGALYAWLGYIMRRVGCSPTC